MADRFAFSPETLIKAYSLGVFPMADSADSHEIKFYDPEVRALIPLAWREGARHEFHIPRRLARTVRRQPFSVTINRDFATVIDECAAIRDGRNETWINRDIRKLYVALRAAFFGESMFSRRTDASKIALVHLVARLRAGGFRLLDAQFTNDHLMQFGIYELNRDMFQERLAAALAGAGDLDLGADSQPMVEDMLAE